MRTLREAYLEGLGKLGWMEGGPEERGVHIMAMGKLLGSWHVRGNCTKPGWRPFGLFAEWVSRGGLRLVQTIAEAAVVKATRWEIKERAIREHVDENALIAINSLLEDSDGWDKHVDGLCEWIANNEAASTTKEPPVPKDVPAWVVVMSELPTVPDMDKLAASVKELEGGAE